MQAFKRIYNLRATLALLAAVAVVQPAFGQSTDLDVEFDIGIGKTDNVARTATNEMEETIGLLGLDFDLSHDSRKINADIRSRFAYMEYFDDTFDNEIIGGFAGVADYQIVDERFFWEVQYNWGQQLQNNFQPSRPDNREDISLLTTGPTFIQPIGERNFIRLQALHTTLEYETQPFDFDRDLGMVGFGRQVTANSSLSLNASAQRVEFDNTFFAPYDSQEFFVRYDFEDSRNTLTANIGHTSIEAGGLEGDGLLYSLDWTRQVTARTSFQLGAGSRYSDQGDIFQIFQSSTQSVGGTGNFSPLGMPFRNDFGSASMRFGADRTTLSLQALFSKEDYELSDDSLQLDREFFSFEMEIEREMSRKFFMLISGTYRIAEYDVFNREDKDLQGRIRFGYRFNPAFNVSLSYAYLRRESTDITSESVENRTVLQFGYIPSWGR